MSDAFVESWRSQLTESLVEVARLAPQAADVDFAVGLLATGVLWPVAAAIQEYDGDAIDAVRELAGPHSKHVLRAVQSWDGDVLAAARALSAAAAQNCDLAAGLQAIVTHFDAANTLAARLGTLPPNVVNSIQAALVNLGGIINIQSLTLNIAHSVEIPPPPRPELAPDIEAFIGRDQELAYFTERLATRHLALISGMAGVGKTLLAAVLARQTMPAEQIFWHTFHEREGIEVVIWKLAAFLAWHGQDEFWRMLQSARQSGDQPAPPETLFDYILQIIEGRAYCLCFDDLHLVDDDPVLVRLVERLRGALSAGRIKLIITARRVPSFVQSVETEALGGLKSEDAHHLLARLGVTLPPDFFHRLFEHTGGNAQFLTLAATVLKRESNAARVIDCLAKSNDIERYLLVEVDERLSEQEQAVMAAVAVLLGYPGSQDVIEAILDGENVRRTLRHLTDRHLLLVREGVEAREYVQHGMVQAFYYDLLSAAKRRAWHRRAAQHYETDELDLLSAAAHYERAQEYAKSVHLATENVRLLIGLYRARPLAALLARFDAARLNDLEWIRVNAALGQVYAFLGERSQARAYYEATVEHLSALAQGQETCKLAAMVFQGLGQLHYNEAPAEAVEWFQRAFASLAQCQETAKPEAEAALYIDLAWAYRRLHKVAEAMGALQNGLDRLPRRPSQLRGDALTRLAALYVSQFDLATAEQYAQVAVENSRHLRDVWHEQSVLVMLATIKHMRCDWRGAAVEYQAALELATAIGDRAAQAALEVNLGVAHTNLGHVQEARSHLRVGLAISQQSQLQNYELKGQLAFARLCMRVVEWGAAQGHLDAAEQLVESVGSADAQFHLPLILSARAEVAFAQGTLDQALQLAQSAVELAIAQEKQVDRATCQRVLAQVLLAQGDVQGARALLEEGLHLLEERHAYEAAKIKALLGQCLLKSGDTARGREQMAAARLTFETCGAAFDLAEVYQQQS